MSDNKQYSLLAVLHEINRRELKNKLNLFPEDLRYYATVASALSVQKTQKGSEKPLRVCLKTVKSLFPNS